MRKTLLIIGAGAEQVPAYERAKQRGYTVVGTDLNPNAPAFIHADHKLMASTRDADETVRVVLAFHRQHPIDGVMTIANDVPYTVAAVAQALGLRGISLEAARCASDKLLMKQRFVQAGVRCPDFWAVDNLEDFKAQLNREPEAQFVIKPTDGRGARGVLLVSSQSDLEWAFSESKRWGDSGQLMLERYVPGMQLSTESFILDGRCYTAAISERNYSRLAEFAPYIIEDGGTVPVILADEQRTALDKLLFDAAQAMGITRGIIKGDIVLDEARKPMVIELAARLSGGWFATHQIPEATGVDLVTAVMLDALGETVTPEQLIPSRNRAVATRYWFPPPGTVTAIEGETELQGLPGLIAYGFFRQVGETQPVIRSHPDRFGYVIVAADTRDEVLTRVNQALKTVRITVEPD